MKGVAILGSTGSVGRSTLAVVDAFRDELTVVGLAAGANIDRLAQQVIKYRPAVVSVRELRDVDRLRSLVPHPIEIVHGADGACTLATLREADVLIAPTPSASDTPPLPHA